MRRTASTDSRDGPWQREARRVLPRMRAWRRELHQYPELANAEIRTRSRIVRALNVLRIPHQTYDGFTGVLGLVGRGRPGPVVALRADMDALPVSERSGLPFASRVPGRMHACGHDVHMSSLLGAAVILKRHENGLGGPVKLVFQPAEEQGEVGGAGPFLERGCFEDPSVDYVVGQHVEAALPLGTIGWKDGPMMAASDHFTIRVRGRGGHAGYPHRGPDAVVAAAEVVQGLQVLVSRIRHPADPVVVSVGSIHGGTRYNVLPEEVVIEGTTRTFRTNTRAHIERALKRRVAHLAESVGAHAAVEYFHGYPPLRTTPEVNRVVVPGLRAEFGPGRVKELEHPEMGAEDFSRYLERAPGTFLFVGVTKPERPLVSNHSPEFAPAEETLVTSAASLVVAVEALQRK